MGSGLWRTSRLRRLPCWSAGVAQMQHAAWGARRAGRGGAWLLPSRAPHSAFSRRRLHAAVAAQTVPAAMLPAVPTAATASMAEAVTPAAAAAEGDGGEAPHVPVLLAEVLSFFQGRLEVYVDGTLGAGGHASALMHQHPEMRTLVGFDLDTTAHAIAAARLQQQGAHVVQLARTGVGEGLAVVPPQPAPAGPAGAAAAAAPPTAYIVHSNFGALRQVLAQVPGASLVGGVDGILLDLGISSMQVDTSERGFSFLRDGPLDMRMDPCATLSAEELINTWPEEELGRMFWEFGEERHWRAVARRVAAARERQPITTTQQLVAAIGGVPLGSSGDGGRRRGGSGSSKAKQKHPATRVFQAIRIAVNGELASIAAAVPDAIDCLRPGGRLSVITFHSLEDRIVKWAFRRAAGMAPSDGPLPSYCLPPAAAQARVDSAAAASPRRKQQQPAQPPPQRAEEEEAPPARVRILTRRPVGPSEDEERANVRSRSAKLRVVEKLPS